MWTTCWQWRIHLRHNLLDRPLRVGVVSTWRGLICVKESGYVPPCTVQASICIVLVLVEHDGAEAGALVERPDGGVERRLIVGLVRELGNASHPLVDGARVASRPHSHEAGVVRETVQHRRQVRRQQHRLQPPASIICHSVSY